ncbi:MAG: autotransporter outer membrane beta-barrel domain-containing protein [Phascolarctobacterium sp.]|uniref:autotransporter outer membrane beta-barrel domain-containing protein n=1 Tax=Phascolarctobacterium sp. TaxID=2049039 RepID=UPI0026DCCCCC|nr:autotransporter outer membrane beta-barrel domain-containing protein [Phascolarctobacterium sp.]MDO4922184.1 autotransporter outer membrane beta-barrel domain-containing protein [Phascolarctobacterium sp.]
MADSKSYFLVFNNRIEITNNSTVSNVTGGLAPTHSGITNNQITIKGSTINGQIVGGFANYTQNSGDSTIWFSSNDKPIIEKNTVNISNSTININSNVSGGDIIGGFSQGSENIDIKENIVTLSGNIKINAKYTPDIYGGSSITGCNLKDNGIIINSDAKITSTTLLNIAGGNNTSGTQKNNLGGIVENNYVKIKGIVESNANIYAGFSTPTTKAASNNSIVTKNYIEISDNASITNANLYGSNNGSNGTNNNLIINQWGGKVKSANNFNNLIFNNLSFSDDLYNGIDNAVFSTTSRSDLDDTKIIITSLSDDTDLIADNKRYLIVDGKNINFKEDNVSLSEAVSNKLEKDMINDDRNLTSNGIRIHNIKIYTNDANSDSHKDISMGVNKSILTGKYTDVDGTAHYNSKSTDKSGKLYLDATVSTNASVIAGSYASSGDATGGTIIISGNYTAAADAKIYAGYSENGAVNNNAILLNGASIGNINLYAYNSNVSSHAGNSAVITGKNNFVNSLNGFDALNFNDIEWENTGSVLTINNSDGQQESLAKTTVNLNSFSNASAIKANDSMLLIKGENLDVDLNNVHDSGFSAGVATIGKGQAEVVNEGLRYTVKEIAANPQVNLIAENRAVAAAFVNQGSDLIADGLASLAEQYDYGFKTFAAVYGNRSSYDVSDDLKINGWSDIVGFGGTHKTSSGDFDWGVFYENGTGNYRTYNNFNSEFFRGDGNLLYNGGGVAARLRRSDGFYYEGSLRVGALKSEMSNAVKDGAGNSYGYESDSTYYGAHVGVGKLFAVGGDKELDVYGKYFHTYVDGDSFNIDGDKITFDSVKSDRVRIGAQLTTNKSNKWSAVYGLAYEYEFSGDSDMRAAQFDLPTQSLEGGTVIGKIGLKFKDAAISPWSLDLNLTGYQGQRDGFSGMVQATYNF